MAFNPMLLNNPKRIELMQLPLVDLMKSPNCGLRCPEGLEFHCGCDGCGKAKGYFKERDKKRLSQSQLEEIEQYKTNNGYYIEGHGCNLPRKLMSEDCLRAICPQFTRYKEDE